MNYRDINDSNYQDNIKDGHKVVLFWADWCNFCKPMKQHLDKLNDKGYICFTCDIENSPKFAHESSLMTLPTVVIYDNGRESKRITGSKTYDQLLAEIESR
jgi:thioredoxin 1